MHSTNLCLYFFVLICLPAFALGAELEFEKLPLGKATFHGNVSVNDKHPLAMKFDDQFYCIFNYGKNAGRKHDYTFNVPVEVWAISSLAQVMYLEEDNTLGLMYQANPGRNDSFVVSLRVEGNSIIGTQEKDKASKFQAYLNRKKTVRVRDEVTIKHYQFEYLEDGKPTGKFLAFDTKEAEFNKKFKAKIGARAMILDEQSKAATFVLMKEVLSGK